MKKLSQKLLKISKQFIWGANVNSKAFFKEDRDPFLLFIISIFIFMANGVSIYSSDDMIPTSVLPFSIFRHMDFDVGRYIFTEGQAIPYYIKQSLHGYVSTSPIGAAITASPFYFLYTLFGGEASIKAGAILGKISASTIAALSGAAFYILLKKLGKNRLNRILFTLLFAVGSETFSISSQSLWQHGPAVFWFVIFLIILVDIVNKKYNSSKNGYLLGASAGMVFLTRPADIILIAPFLLLLLRREHWRYIVKFIVGFAPIFILNIFYNYYYFGSYTSSGYGSTEKVVDYFSYPTFNGILGNLFSPSKGLFIYMPWALISFLWLTKVTTKEFYKTIYAPALLVLFPYIILYAKFFQWPGGNSYGPRYMTDLVPVLALLASGYAYHYGKFIQRSFVKLLSNVLMVLVIFWSVLLQFLGSYVQFNNTWYSAAWPNNFTEPLWSLESSQFIYHLNSLAAAYNPPQQLKSRNLEVISITLLDKPLLYEAAKKPTVFEKGKAYVGKAEIKNTGTEIWPAFPKVNGANVVHFGYMGWSGENKVIEGARSTLFHSVKPNDSITVYFSFQTPDKPGKYDYIFTLIQEGVAWFQDKNINENAAKVTIEVQ